MAAKSVLEALADVLIPGPQQLKSWGDIGLSSYRATVDGFCRYFSPGLAPIDPTADVVAIWLLVMCADHLCDKVEQLGTAEWSKLNFSVPKEYGSYHLTALIELLGREGWKLDSEPSTSFPGLLAWKLTPLEE